MLGTLQPRAFRTLKRIVPSEAVPYLLYRLIKHSKSHGAEGPADITVSMCFGKADGGGFESHLGRIFLCLLPGE